MRWPNPLAPDDEEIFDSLDSFNPEHLPSPGPFLEGQDLLDNGDHVSVHQLSRDIFEDRGIYDLTFGYNLARLNLDRRHPDAGIRYARERTTPSVLRASFTPTTPFCPQAETLALGAFRAWNGLTNWHPYELVRVRVAPMHHRSEEINEQLADDEREFRETGALTGRAP